MRMKFRRATHDRDGRYREEIFGHDKESHHQKEVWRVHGGIAHLLTSEKGMSYEEVLEQIRKDVTNYIYHPCDLEVWQDGEKIPTPENVALSLIRLIEVGFVEVVND